MDSSFLERLSQLETRFKKFSMVGNNEVLVAGNLKTGFTVNVNREPEGATPSPTPTGACCLPDNSCVYVSEADCIAAGGIYQGDGTPCLPNPCGAPTTCLTCDDLPPTNPTGPPVHINIGMTISGTCGTLSFAGTVTYDTDLGFGLEGPVEGHNFCAHNIGGGPPWSGHWTETCTLNGATLDFGSGGAVGLLGRDTNDCTWWMTFPQFNNPLGVGTCSSCAWSVTPLPFQMIAGAGGPTGVYVFSDTDAGVTLTITVTIS